LRKLSAPRVKVLNEFIWKLLAPRNWTTAPPTGSFHHSESQRAQAKSSFFSAGCELFAFYSWYARSRQTLGACTALETICDLLFQEVLTLWCLAWDLPKPVLCRAAEGSIDLATMSRLALGRSIKGLTVNKAYMIGLGMAGLPFPRFTKKKKLLALVQHRYTQFLICSIRDPVARSWKLAKAQADLRPIAKA
jgi:hypothetical protein